MSQPAPPERRHRLAQPLSLALLLTLLWLVLSGHFSPLLLGLGLASVLFVVLLHWHMGLVDHEAQPLRFGLGLLPFAPWLLRELLLSNLDVIKRIWLGPGSIHPVVKCLPVPMTTDLGRVVYANAITLTPGTLSIDLDDDHVRVHALTPAGIAALESGDMARRVKALEH